MLSVEQKDVLEKWVKVCEKTFEFQELKDEKLWIASVPKLERHGLLLDSYKKSRNEAAFGLSNSLRESGILLLCTNRELPFV